MNKHLLIILLAFSIFLFSGVGVLLAVDSSKPIETILFGKVNNVSNNKVIINENGQGKQVEAVIDKNTPVVGQNKKLLNVRSLKPNDNVVVISTESAQPASGSAKTAQIRKVYVQEASAAAQMKRRAVSGVITSIDGSVITLTHLIQKDRTFKITVNNTTLVKIKGVEAAKLTDLRPGQRIAAVGDLDVSGNIIAKMVHVIPGQAIGALEKNPLATPSATVTATPSATPTLTASPSATPQP